MSNVQGEQLQTNRPVPPDNAVNACQVDRICANCSLAARLLGTAWCLPGASEMIYKTILTAIVMTSARRPWDQFYFGHPHECHECGSECHLTGTKQQAERRMGPLNMSTTDRKRKGVPSQGYAKGVDIITHHTARLCQANIINDKCTAMPSNVRRIAGKHDDVKLQQLRALRDVSQCKDIQQTTPTSESNPCYIPYMSYPRATTQTIHQYSKGKAYRRSIAMEQHELCLSYTVTALFWLLYAFYSVFT